MRKWLGYIINDSAGMGNEAMFWTVGVLDGDEPGRREAHFENDLNPIRS
jgi:hypothetical protein